MRVPWQCVTLCYAQVVNHFSKATSITTKSGLMKSLRQLRWFEPVDIDTFFPRCYDLSDPGDYADFVEDYKATVAERQLKRVVVAVVAAAGGYTGAGAGAGAGAGTGAGAGAGAGAGVASADNCVTYIFDDDVPRLQSSQYVLSCHPVCVTMWPLKCSRSMVVAGTLRHYPRFASTEVLSPPLSMSCASTAKASMTRC